MDMFLTNTINGLVPIDEESADKKSRLKLGKTYRAKVNESRKYEFHKKYMALIKCAWEFQHEKVTNFFKDDMHKFRKYLEITAGHSEMIFHPRLKDWVEIPKSISFDEMSQVDFEDLYNKVYVVLFKSFLSQISQEEFENNLKNF